MTLLAAVLLAALPVSADDICALPALPDKLEPAALDMQALDEIIRVRPDCAGAHFLRGFAMLDDANNDKEGALRFFEQALEYAPGNARILFWLGQTHGALAAEQSSLSHALECRDYLEQAVAADPEHIDARAALAGYHRNAPWIAGGRIKVAYEQAGEIRKRDLRRGLLEQARTLMADDKEEEALALARTTLQQFPDHVPLAIEYALAMHEREDYAEAQRVLFPVTRSEDADLNALYQLGRTAALAGEYVDEGRMALNRYIQRAKSEPVAQNTVAAAWWRLGMVERHAKNLPAAREAFERAVQLDPQREEAAAALRALAAPEQ